MSDVHLYVAGRAAPAVAEGHDTQEPGVFLEVDAVQGGGLGAPVKTRLLLSLDDVFRLAAELEWAAKTILAAGLAR